jgi:hypothetical protein
MWAQNFQCFALDSNGDLYSWGLNDVHYYFKIFLVLSIRK